uniref:Uncharacterized protein n=1 Tax=Solanum lycopersicum TaxID=4081 RepID=A0A3Q7IZR3_SOLLC
MVKLLTSTVSRLSTDSPTSRCIILTSSILKYFKVPLPTSSKSSSAQSFKCRFSRLSASNINLSKLIASM